jgi:O-antigen/teichoic acid export membrane protein
LQEIALRDKLFNGVLWLGATKTLGQAISWFITIYVARLLMPEDYGLMGMAALYIGLLGLFNELGFGAVIIQKKDLADEDLSNICWGLIAANLGLYLISLAAAPLIAYFFNEPRLIAIIRISATTLLVGALGAPSYYLMARTMLFNNRSQAEFIANLLGSIVALFFAYRGFGVWSLVYSNLVIESTKTVLFLFFYPYKPALRFSINKLKGDLNFGLKVAVARLFWYVYTNADFLVAGRLLGKTFLGYYSLAFQIASIPIDKVVSLVTQVAFPAFASIQDDNRLLGKYFLTIVRWIACVTFPVFFGMFLVADAAVGLFLSDKWVPMIFPLKVLCVVSTLRAINAVNAPLVLAKGKSGVVMLNNLILAVVLIAAFFIGSVYGFRAFSCAWLIFPVPFVITTWLSLKSIGVSLAEYFRELKHPFQGTLVMAAIVAISQGTILNGAEDVRTLVAAVAIGLTSYSLYQMVFNRHIFGELKSFFVSKVALDA